MALRIQLRRDIASNWTTNNPILLSGELGIETDTARFKIGNGGRWNSITSYAFKVGEANGVASLGPTGKLITSQLPDSFSVTADVQAAISALSTTNIAEGSNKYYTDQRAIDANISAISGAISTEISARNAQITTSKIEAVNIAATDATTKAAAAKAEAIAAASTAADTKVATGKQEAINTAATYTNSQITAEISNRNSAINTAISTEIINRNVAIAAAAVTLAGHTTNELTEGTTNKYFTDARAKAAVASDIATAVAGTTFSLSSKTTNDLAEGTLNKYFTSQRAVQAAAPAIEASALDVITSVNGYTDERISSLSTVYLPISGRNANNGIAGLDSSGLILTSAIPSSIARTSDITTAISNIVGAAPTSFDTLKEIADYIASDQSAGTALTTLVGTKAPIASPTFTGTVVLPENTVKSSDLNWDVYGAEANLPAASTKHGMFAHVHGTGSAYFAHSGTWRKILDTATAESTYATVSNVALKAPLSSPLFTGAVSFTGATSVNFTGVSVTGLGTNASLPPQGGNQGKYLTTNGIDPSWSTITLSDYLTSATAATTYLTIANAENNYVQQTNLENQLDAYILEGDRNQSSGFAGLNASGYILPGVIGDLSITGLKLADGTITNAKLLNATISNAKLEKAYIVINGSNINLGETVQTKTYSNFNNPSEANRLGYGTSPTPNVTSAVAGDIYIQY